jgi:hypothetical protein
MRAPRLDLDDVRLLDQLDALDTYIRVLAGGGRLRSPDDLVLVGLVYEAITDLQLHRQDALLSK